MNLELVGVYAALTLASAFALSPILWCFSTSLKTANNAVAIPPQWIPQPATLDNYVLVMGSSLPRYFVNSVIVSLLTVVLTVVVAALGGYAAARFNFRGKNSVLLGILSTVMVPGVVILVPLYMIASALGIIDTYFVLVLVFTAWQAPAILWLMRGFFEGIPRDLEEAAQIDGCTPLGALVRVILPVARPGLAAAAILVFVYVWNEFIVALVLTTSDDMRVLPVGLYFYISAFGVQWGQLTAAITVAIVPVIVVFLALQRHFIQGLTRGAVKG
jgi:ABC-type glycerol-3-phosphate transport system permease component